MEWSGLQLDVLAFWFKIGIDFPTVRQDNSSKLH